MANVDSKILEQDFLISQLSRMLQNKTSDIINGLSRQAFMPKIVSESMLLLVGYHLDSNKEKRFCFNILDILEIPRCT